MVPIIRISNWRGYTKLNSDTVEVTIQLKIYNTIKVELLHKIMVTTVCKQSVIEGTVLNDQLSFLK